MKRTILIFLVCVLGINDQCQAQGDLLITPMRVVFEGNKQKETLNLVNIGKDTATYSVSFLQYAMNENGGFEAIENADSGQMFADPYLRIFPRRIILAPGEPQAIMLQFRRKANMKAGEYRSHLYFRSEKQNKPLGMNTPDKEASGLQVQLVPIFGLSIPIIIRTGEVNVQSSLSNLELESREGEQYLKFTINRTGNISLYGDLVIEYVPLQGKPYEVGAVQGVGVYTSVNKRNAIVKLNNTTPLTNGRLRVRYVNADGKKKIVYALGELNIGS